MALKLFLGGPHSSCSEKMREEMIRQAVKNPRKRFIMLVPEQFTLQTQRDMVAAHPNHAILNIDVLSFDRLAYRVLGEQVRPLTEIGKHMLLRRAAGAHREELKLYRRSLTKPGFISRLMAILSEFYQYGVTEENLRETERRLNGHPLLQNKLRELRIFYHALEEMKGDGSVLKEELSSLCLKEIGKTDFLKGTVIAMDHYTGFTPVQRELIREMLVQAEDVCAAFLLPEEEDREEELRESELFYMSRHTVRQLTALAASGGIPAERIFVPESGGGVVSGELAFLARNFLRYSKEEEAYFGTHHRIRVYAAANPREEAAQAAAAIAKLVREENLRYREIAVIAGDLEEYRTSLTEEFGKAGIPYYCDRKRGVLGNPLVEFLRSALDVPEKSFSYESVFRYLRSGMTALDREEIDRLDLYVSAAGIRGRHSWEKEWDRNPDGMDEAELASLNESRMRVLKGLEPVLSGTGKTVMERTALLREMMKSVDAGAVMEERARLVRQAGYAERAEEFSRITEFLEDLLDQMDELLGKQSLNRQEFSDILDAGLEAGQLGILPQGLDVVQIGDVRRSRLSDVKALLVLGLNEGKIPAPAAEGGILTEWERSLLAREEMELAPEAEISAVEERFYLYTLMTRPSEKLALSYSLRNGDGTQARPSWFLNQLRHLFPDLKVEPVDLLPLHEKISGRESAWQILSEVIRRQSDPARPFTDPESRELLQALCAEGGEERLLHILQAAFRVYRGEKLDAASARKLYGKELTGSVTRMETYASCAARHFLAYGLRLKEKKEYDVSAAGRGTFFHRILQIFFALLKREGLSPKTLEPEKREELIRKALRRASETEDAGRMLGETASGKYLYGRWEKLARTTIGLLCEQLSGGDFTPEAFELHFSGRDNAALRADLGDGAKLLLDGTVDRLDIYEENGKRYLRIVDYKTGTKRFNLNEIWQGLSLQLSVYLGAVLEMKTRGPEGQENLPAGMYYQLVQETVVDTKAAETKEGQRKERLKALRLNGLSSGMPEVTAHQEQVSAKVVSAGALMALEEHARRKMAEDGKEILEGQISASPVRQGKNKACEYCPYKAVCGFDPKVEGYRFRRIEGISEEDIWQRLLGEDDQ